MSESKSPFSRSSMPKTPSNSFMKLTTFSIPIRRLSPIHGGHELMDHCEATAQVIIQRSHEFTARRLDEFGDGRGSALGRLPFRWIQLLASSSFFSSSISKSNGVARGNVAQHEKTKVSARISHVEEFRMVYFALTILRPPISSHPRYPMPHGSCCAASLCD